MFEDTLLYDGKITLRFDSIKHQYRVLNKGREYKVPSVTRITGVLDKSGPLVNWAINNTLEVCKGAIGPGVEYAETYLNAVWDAAKKASRDIKAGAAERGKQRHAAIERSLNVTDPSQNGSQDAVGEWLQTIASEVRAVERRLYSRRHKFSGTLDCIVGSQAGLVLIDWKTSKSIYPEFRLQTAAYVHAYEEEFPDQKIEGRYLVRILEDGSIEPFYFPRSTLRHDFNAFLGAKSLFEGVQRIERETRKLSKLQRDSHLGSSTKIET